MSCVSPRLVRVGKHLKKVVCVPCGKCPGCLEDKQKDWSIRILYESLDYIGRTWFIRLSYRDSELVYIDDVPTLYKPHLQLFMRYLRRRVECRFFACGEYGDEKGRPHYHVVLFLSVELSKSDVINLVESCWSHGFTNVRPFAYYHSLYVAKYTLKSCFYETYGSVQPPFFLMSRKPGIGSNFVSRFKENGLSPTRDCPRDLQGRPFRWSRFLKDKCFTDSDKVIFKAINHYRMISEENRLMCRYGRNYYKIIVSQENAEYERKYNFLRSRYA